MDYNFAYFTYFTLFSLILSTKIHENQLWIDYCFSDYCNYFLLFTIISIVLFLYLRRLWRLYGLYRLYILNTYHFTITDMGYTIHYTFYTNYDNYFNHIFNMRKINNMRGICHDNMSLCIVILAWRSALYLCGWLTLFRDLL